MDFPAIQAFIAVAETGSFSAAADRLHLTQPAITKRVAGLEADLGARVFDRIGRQVALTESGQALLPNARRVVEAMEDSRRAVTNLSGRIGGRLRVGTSHHIGLHRLPPILRRFHDRYPDVELDIRFMDSEEACRAIETGDLELAVVTLPLAPGPNLKVHTVWRDPLAVVTGPAHPLGRRKRLLPSDLAQHTAILPSERTYTRQALENALQPLGIELQVGLSTNYLETIKMLVSVGLGWSILPLTMVDAEITVHRVDGLRLSRDLGLVEHRARTLSNAALAFRAEVGATATGPGRERPAG